MAEKKKGLGRGLGELFVPNEELPSEGGVVISAPIEKVYPDADQHRKTFHDETLQELAESIRLHGVIQPLLVRKFGTGYQIIAGERRYRASKMAGLTEIPVIVKDFDAQKASEAALIENLQREDLNPIDEANGYAQLMKSFNLTQEQAAKQIGKSRAYVANTLRLLNLPAAAQSLLKRGDISAGHARALLPLKDEEEINDMLSRIVERDLSVREVEDIVRFRLEGGKNAKKLTRKKEKNEVYLAQLKRVSERATAHLGRKVRVRDDGSGRGRIEVEYFDAGDLEEVLGTLCGEGFLANLQ